MNILELDRFMTKVAREAMLSDAAVRGVPAEGARFDTENTLREWREAFREQCKSDMSISVQEASKVTGQPPAVCDRWLTAYTPVVAVTTRLRLV